MMADVFLKQHRHRSDPMPKNSKRARSRISQGNQTADEGEVFDIPEFSDTDSAKSEDGKCSHKKTRKRK